MRILNVPLNRLDLLRKLSCAYLQDEVAADAKLIQQEALEK